MESFLPILCSTNERKIKVAGLELSIEEGGGSGMSAGRGGSGKLVRFLFIYYYSHCIEYLHLFSMNSLF